MPMIPLTHTPQGEFYKTFTRPVAKTLLLALLTYQIIYWGWAKLEVDEIKQERTGMPPRFMASPPCAG